MTPPEPAMSVVLVTPDNYRTIARTVDVLARQSAASQLELVVVAPDPALTEIPDALRKRFAAVQFVEIGRTNSIAAAHAAGVRRSSASIVAFAEDHAFPHSEWAAAMIAAHTGPWTAVGPAMRNANPDSNTSCADFLLGYGRWQTPAVAGPTDHIPGHNSSYKRAALLEYGPALEERLQTAAVLHADLAAKGHRLYLEPAAVVSHTNFGKAGVWLRLRFHAGRAFAASRAEGWPLLRRILYIGASPLVPFVRLGRIVRESRRKDQPRWFFPRIAPILFFGLALDAVGEVIGYAFGAPSTRAREWDWEFHRERYS